MLRSAFEAQCNSDGLPFLLFRSTFTDIVPGMICLGIIELPILLAFWELMSTLPKDIIYQPFHCSMIVVFSLPSG